jgi:hypothetical protein
MKRPNKDPLYRLARRIHRQLQDAAEAAPAERLRRIGVLGEASGAVCQARLRLTLARSRGWDGVAGKLQRQLLERLPRLQLAVQDVLDHRDAPFPAAALPLLLAELRQLHDEFEQVTIDLDDEGEDRIAVTTDPIVLQGLALGPFCIELHLERMVQRSDSSAFRIVALDPNPSERNEFVTHPHVSDYDLCAGDATVPIALALAQGRLCDAFVLVNSVLHTYNPRSAYVPIEEWRAITCPDCQCTDCESLICCEACGRAACDGCSGTCGVCERCCCGGCMEYDPVAHQDCCSNCRGRCEQCNRIVVHDDLDEQSGLCPQCLAEQQPPQPQPEENPHELEPCPSCVLVASTVQAP